MNKSSLLLVGLLAAIGIDAQADELYAPDPSRQPAVSSVSRADVRRETVRAIAAGEVSFGDVDRATIARGDPGRTGGRSRDEVREELLQALAAHEVPFGDVDASPKNGDAWVGSHRPLFALRKH